MPKKNLRGFCAVSKYWARPAILVAGKGRWEMFLFLSSLSFLFSFFSIPFFNLLHYFFSPFHWEMTQNDPQGLMCH